MTPTQSIATIVCVVCGLSIPARADTMAKLDQCRYEGPVISTCSTLYPDNEVFKICAKEFDKKAPAYTLAYEAKGMMQYAVEIRRDGRKKPHYRNGVSGFPRAEIRFRLSGLEHVVAGDSMLVIEHRKNGSKVEVWKRVRCKKVKVNIDELERKASKGSAGD